jgi:micrococcal nuclease
MNYAGVLGLSVTFLMSGSIAAAAELESAKCRASDWPGRNTLRARIVSVSDGDTVRIAVGSKSYSVRFLTIDAPELHFQGLSQGYWAERAHERLQDLLPIDAQVTIRLDEERCDRYGRVLGYVIKDGRDINRVLVNEGLAVTYCIYPNTQVCEQYGAATERARAANRGFFSDPSVELPYEFRRIESGRPHEKLVGDFRTGRVYQPGQAFRVPVGYRVYFMSEEDVKSPYYLASRSR